MAPTARSNKRRTSLRLGGLWLRRMGSGPVLLALHGGPGLDHTSLLPLARRLSRDFEVWLPDLPGHGRSRLPSGRPPGLTRLQRRLYDWLRRHAPRPHVLLGHSLGAWLVREAVRPPSPLRFCRPRRLVLLSPPVAGRDAARDGRRSAVRRGVRELPVSSDPLGEVLAHVRDECDGAVPSELLGDLRRGHLEPATAYGALLRNLHRRFTGPLRLFPPPCPTLVLCGGADRTTPPDVAVRLDDGERTRVEILPGLGHYLHAQDPDGIAGRIRSFASEEQQHSDEDEG